jgi:hypothetical protein
MTCAFAPTAVRTVAVAADPDAKAKPCVPDSSEASWASSARRLGLSLLEYSKPYNDGLSQYTLSDIKINFADLVNADGILFKGC